MLGKRLLVGVTVLLLLSFGPIARAVTIGGWVTKCPYSHRLSDDPIVYPNQPGASHSHDFFGNTTTDARSTYASLLAGSTTCFDTRDTAAYWTPTLLKNGANQTPGKLDVYYRTQVAGSQVRAFPRGLVMIAGDSHATGPQSLDVVYYNCHSGPDQHDAAVPYDCGNNTVDVHIVFPQCWDGVHLDSSDHKSHMAYAIRSHGAWVCPTTHPVAVPRLIMRVSWSITNGNGVSLASGPAYTMHADFFNAWNQTGLQTLVHDCIQAGVDCGTVP